MPIDEVVMAMQRISVLPIAPLFPAVAVFVGQRVLVRWPLIGVAIRGPKRHGRKSKASDYLITSDPHIRRDRSIAPPVV